MTRSAIHTLLLEGGVVSITARCEDHGLLLVVEDNGVGFDSAVAGRVQGKAGNGAGGLKSPGVGLTNITQRLRALYGEQAELLFERPPKDGCRVIIKIPS